MTLTFGFYDSVTGDRVYNAEQISSIFDGIIEDGVYAELGDELQVFQNTGMDVKIGSGRAWFDHTWSMNDDWVGQTVDTAHAILNRIDIIFLEINSDTGVRANKLDYIAGTPATEPVPPTLTQTATTHQYPLAHIYVGAAVTEIFQANITNKVGYTETPYVTGILDRIAWNELIEWLDGRLDLIEPKLTEKTCILEIPVIAPRDDTTYDPGTEMISGIHFDDLAKETWCRGTFVIPKEYVSNGRVIVWGRSAAAGGTDFRVEYEVMWNALGATFPSFYTGGSQWTSPGLNQLDDVMDLNLPGLGSGFVAGKEVYFMFGRDPLHADDDGSSYFIVTSVRFQYTGVLPSS